MTSLGFIDSTTKLSVTDSPASFDVTGPEAARRSYVVTSDIALHIARNADASAGDARIPADTPVSVSAFAGDTLSFLRGDSDNGNVWITLRD